MNAKRFNQLFHCTLIALLLKNGQCKEIDSKTDLQEEEANDPEIRSPAYMPKPKSSSNPSYYGKGEAYDDETSKDGHSSPPNNGPNQQRSNEGPWPLERPDVPLIKGIHVRCEKNSMSVKVDFDRPFYGVIFSKGHYNDPKCVHTPAATGRSEISFDLRLDACGMVGSDEAQGSRGSSKPWLFTESTIIIQHDPQVQEVWDQARRLRCTWYDFYEKTVSFKSLNVEMMDAVTTNFLGDNIQCWMQIQAGKGPFNSEATGLVKIGQTMTMVLAIKDDDGKFDMLVRNCVAHDGHHRPIQLVDEYGCITRPRIMSKFKKIKNFGYSASVASYAYFRAFKFPDSVNVHFQCVIQVCRESCPPTSCSETGSEPTFHPDEGEETRPSATAVDLAGNRQPTTGNGPIGKQQSTSINLVNGNGKYTGPSLANAGAVPRVLVASQSPHFDDLNRTWPLPAATFIHPKTLASHPLYPRFRTRRSINNSTDISTTKTIRVVAPGDISFDFSATTDQTETLDIFGSDASSSRSLISIDPSNRYCVSGIVLTLSIVIIGLMLIVSSLIAVFLYLRVNLMNRSFSVSLKDSISYQNLDPSKAASLRSLQVKTPGEGQPGSAYPGGNNQNFGVNPQGYNGAAPPPPPPPPPIPFDFNNDLPGFGGNNNNNNNAPFPGFGGNTNNNNGFPGIPNIGAGGGAGAPQGFPGIPALGAGNSGANNGFNPSEFGLPTGGSGGGGDGISELANLAGNGGSSGGGSALPIPIFGGNGGSGGSSFPGLSDSGNSGNGDFNFGGNSGDGDFGFGGGNNNNNDDFGFASSNNNGNNEFDFGTGSGSENFDINLPSPTIPNSMLTSPSTVSTSTTPKPSTSTSTTTATPKITKKKSKRSTRSVVNNEKENNFDLEAAADESSFDFDPNSSYGMLNLDPRYQNPNQGVYTNYADYRVH